VVFFFLHVCVFEFEYSNFCLLKIGLVDFVCGRLFCRVLGVCLFMGWLTSCDVGGLF